MSHIPVGPLTDSPTQSLLPAGSVVAEKVPEACMAGSSYSAAHTIISFCDILGQAPPPFGLPLFCALPPKAIAALKPPPLPDSLGIDLAQCNIIAMLTQYLKTSYVKDRVTGEQADRDPAIASGIQKGICHGLSMMWLYYAGMGKIQEWETYLGTMIKQHAQNPEHCKSDAVFREHLEWLCNAVLWLQRGDVWCDSGDQCSLSDAHLGKPSFVLTEVDCFYGKLTELINYLRQRQRNGDEFLMIGTVNHSMALVSSGSAFKFYDPSFELRRSPGRPLRSCAFFVQISQRYTDAATVKAVAIGSLSRLDPISKDPQALSEFFDFMVHIGCDAAVSKLLRLGADPRIATEPGILPLFLAAKKGHTSIVKQLLEDPRTDPNVGNKEDVSPLMAAVCNLHRNIVTLLLEDRRTDPNLSDSRNGITPLCMASFKGYDEIVACLLSAQGIDPNLGEGRGQTPLYGASSQGHTRVVELLLAVTGIIPDPATKKGQTPLFMAAVKGHTDIIRLLLDAMDHPGIDEAGIAELCKTAGKNDIPLFNAHVRKMGGCSWV